MQGRSERVQCLGVDTEGISISVDKGLNLLPSLALSLFLSLGKRLLACAGGRLMSVFTPSWMQTSETDPRHLHLFL